MWLYLQLLRRWCKDSAQCWIADSTCGLQMASSQALVLALHQYPGPRWLSVQLCVGGHRNWHRKSLWSKQDAGCRISFDEGSLSRTRSLPVLGTAGSSIFLSWSPLRKRPSYFCSPECTCYSSCSKDQLRVRMLSESQKWRAWENCCQRES